VDDGFADTETLRYSVAFLEFFEFVHIAGRSIGGAGGLGSVFIRRRFEFVEVRREKN
jgi:hypothetical protein